VTSESGQRSHRVRPKDASRTAPKPSLTKGMRAIRNGDAFGAKHAFRKTLEAGDSNAAAEAAYQLGKLVFYEGDLPEALTYFQQATLGDASVAPLGCNGAGVVLEHMGRLQEARRQYVLAIESGHETASARAAWNLGRLLAGEKDLEAAASAYKHVMASGEVELAARAALQLGLLREDAGDVGDASDAFRQALASPEASTSEAAALRLGHLLAARGDVSGAADVWHMAGDSDDPERAEAARALLSQLTFGAASPNALSGSPETSITLGSGAGIPPDAQPAGFGAAQRRSTSLTVLDEIIALRSDDADGDAAVLKRFQGDLVYALGHPAGQVSNGKGTESDLVHYESSEGGEQSQTRLPVFTQPSIMRRALLRNPEWQSTFVLQVNGGLLYENVDAEVTIVLNPWSRLECALPPRQPAARKGPATSLVRNRAARRPTPSRLGDPTPH
jgi:tetratricopeptide (TPR) repeat protein